MKTLPPRGVLHRPVQQPVHKAFPPGVSSILLNRVRSRYIQVRVTTPKKKNLGSLMPLHSTSYVMSMGLQNLVFVPKSPGRLNKLYRQENTREI